MSDQLQEQIQKSPGTIMTEEQKTEYSESLRSRFWDEENKQKSKELHDNFYRGDKRSFEINLFDSISLKSDENASFIQRAKDLIANRDSYAYSDQVENAVNKYLDSEEFATGNNSNKFIILDEIDLKQRKARQKEIVKHVNSHGIESLNNIDDIRTWMEAHIAIKGDDKGQFTKILDALTGLQVQFFVKAPKESVLERINDLSDALQDYLSSHKKKPFSTKGKERIAICQTLMAITGKLYFESEKTYVEGELSTQRESMLRDYDYDGISSDEKASVKDLVYRADMKDWIIANTNANDNPMLLDARNAFLDFFYLTDKPDVDISGPDAIIRTARTFKAKASMVMESEDFKKQDELRALINEADRVEACMKWAKKHDGRFYKESLWNGSYTPQIMDFMALARANEEMPKEYIESLEKKTKTELSNFIKEEKEKNKKYAVEFAATEVKEELIGEAFYNNEINEIVKKFGVSPINDFLKFNLVKISISKHDPNGREDAIKNFVEQLTPALLNVLDSLAYTEEVESMEWFMQNVDKVEALCKCGEGINALKSSKEFSPIFDKISGESKQQIESRAEQWKAYRDKMAVKLYKEKRISYGAV